MVVASEASGFFDHPDPLPDTDGLVVSDARRTLPSEDGSLGSAVSVLWISLRGDPERLRRAD